MKAQDADWYKHGWTLGCQESVVGRGHRKSSDFINTDIRDVRFENEFDVVLNFADGAIGYLETDEENLKYLMLSRVH